MSWVRSDSVVTAATAARCRAGIWVWAPLHNPKMSVVDDSIFPVSKYVTIKSRGIVYTV